MERKGRQREREKENREREKRERECVNSASLYTKISSSFLDFRI